MNIHEAMLAASTGLCVRPVSWAKHETWCAFHRGSLVKCGLVRGRAERLSVVWPLTQEIALGDWEIWKPEETT